MYYTYANDVCVKMMQFCTCDTCHVPAWRMVIGSHLVGFHWHQRYLVLDVNKQYVSLLTSSPYIIIWYQGHTLLRWFPDHRNSQPYNVQDGFLRWIPKLACRTRSLRSSKHMQSAIIAPRARNPNICSPSLIMHKHSAIQHTCCQESFSALLSFAGGYMYSIYIPYDLSFYNITASTWTLATPRTTLESHISRIYSMCMYNYINL